MSRYSSGRGRLRIKTILFASIGLGGLIAATSASAAADPAADAAASSQPASAVGDGEIVVTGTRRGDTSVKDTPMAISAFSGETLERQKITSLSDLRLLDPSINIQSYGAAQTKIVLRGIDSNVGATSALYLDEAAVVGGVGGNILGDGKPGIRLYDIDHVEVLNGPQGTLFGTSSMSGTLRVITRKPDLANWGGSAEIDGAGVDHGNPEGQVHATINAPIVTDKLAVRITGWLEDGGGYIDQEIDGTKHYPNHNDAYVRGVRGELLFKPTENFSILAEATHQQISVDGTQSFQITNRDYLNTSPTIELYRDNYNLYSVVGTYDIGFGSLIATGNYSDQNVLNAKDSTPTNHLYGLSTDLSFVPRVWFKDYNTELRFSSKFSGPFQIVAGGYYEHSNALYQTNAIQAPDGVPACFSYAQCVAGGYDQPGHQSIYEFGTNTKSVTDQYAGYAQADYHFLHTLTATAGIRYFAATVHDIVTNLQTVYPDFVFGEVTTPSVTGDSTGHNHKPSYNFALLWEPTHNISLYARAASGFRIGGVNTATSLAQAAGVKFPGTFGPDSLWDYEGGIKAYFLDRKIYLDLSVYHVDWKNEQLSATAATTFAYTINAGKTTSNGVEFNTTVKPFKGLTISGNVTYVDAKLDEDLPAAVLAAGTIGYKGDRIPLTPHWTSTVNGEYEHPINQRLSGFVGGDLTYHGESYSSFNEENAFDTRLPAYTLIGARIGVRTPKWEASLYGQNLGGSVPYLGIVESVDGIRVFTAAPRTIGGRLRVNF